MREFILAIDQGTTGSTALAMGLDGRIIDRSTVNFPQHYPKPGWVEHDLGELWSSVQGAVCQLLEKAKLDVRDVLCIGITNQRETSAVWHQKTGEVAGKAIVWQCRRTASRCAELKEAGRNLSCNSARVWCWIRTSLQPSSRFYRSGMHQLGAG